MTIDTCIQKMTLQEKAALLQGKTSWTTWNIPRLGIPSIFVADGPHGLRKQAGAEDHLGLNESVPATCFPTAATMANSWNPELGQELGRALGQEAAANDVHVVLGPGLNMKRSPLCGRNFEYFSEDPYLAGKMAAAYVRGIQENGVGACPKHFAVNSQELRRMAMDAVVDERTLREIYLTGFEIAVKEGNPKTLMTSYNAVNGTYANENTHLLDILRKEWGFNGFVMSDWGGSNDHIAGVRAGSNLEMPGPGPDSALELIRGVKAGEIPESVLDQRVRELLQVVFDTNEAVVHAAKIYDRHGHHRLAQKCAGESIVLLENDGILPLQPGTKVAVIGDFGEKPRYQGAGSSLVNPNMMTNLKDWIYQTPLKLTEYAQGYRRAQTQPDPDLTKAAMAAAKSADVVLFCMGLDETAESEGADREHMQISQVQLSLLNAVHMANPNVVLVLSGGSPFVMPPKENYRAAIHGYLGGQAGAAAMAEALWGHVNPSGHLAETWPEALEDTPAYHYYPSAQWSSEYREGLYIGYRYYETANVPVRYPFGHGLSYTTFAYSNMETDGQKVSFTLTNTGTWDGAEVAQVYITCRTGKVFRPRKELKGFQKVFLKAGESKHITITLDDKAFRYFNTVTNRFETETANYEISVGSSVRDIRLSATVRVFGTDAPVPTEELPSYRTGNITQVSDEEFTALLGRPIPNGNWGTELTVLDTVSRFADAKNPIARFIGKRVGKSIEKARAKGDPAPNALYVYNMPIRAFGQMTKGHITRQMTKDLVFWVNGHSLRGLYRFGRDYFRGRKAAKVFYESLKNKKQ